MDTVPRTTREDHHIAEKNLPHIINVLLILARCTKWRRLPGNQVLNLSNQDTLYRYSHLHNTRRSPYSRERKLLTQSKFCNLSVLCNRTATINCSKIWSTTILYTDTVTRATREDYQIAEDMYPTQSIFCNLSELRKEMATIKQSNTQPDQPRDSIPVPPFAQHAKITLFFSCHTYW